MHNSSLYLKYREGRHWDRHPTTYVRRFAEALGNCNGPILDLGCGSGRDTAFLFNLGLNVIGVDKSEEEVGIAKLNYPDARFETADVEALPFGDNLINALYMVNVIHYVDPQRALSEAFRVLRPRGLFLIHFNLQIVDNRTGHVDYEQKEETIHRLVRAFEIVHRHQFQRTDREPFEHTHDVLELMLRKA